MTDSADPARALAVARGAAREAGELLHAAAGGVAAVPKDAYELTSAADAAAEQLILSRIRTAFPGHHVLTEESGNHGPASPHCWVVDPLDGTHNYLRGLPTWGVSVAYAYRDRTMVAAFYAAGTDVEYTAVRGGGAYRGTSRLRLTSTTDLARALAICSASPPPWKERAREILLGLWDAAHDIRITGCGGEALCRVADGSVDVFAEVDGQAWDYAAGVLIVQEAGGVVSGHDGRPVTAWSGDVVATTNPRLHAQVRTVISQTESRVRR
ncbi:inositol monophosphatase family protein [Micromonospora sp. RB23]